MGVSLAPGPTLLVIKLWGRHWGEGLGSWIDSLRVGGMSKCNLWSYNGTSLNRIIQLPCAKHAHATVIANWKTGVEQRQGAVLCTQWPTKLHVLKTGSCGTNCTCIVASYLAREPSVSVPSSPLSMEKQQWWLNVPCSHSNTTRRSV